MFHTSTYKKTIVSKFTSYEKKIFFLILHLSAKLIINLNGFFMAMNSSVRNGHFIKIFKK